MSAGGKPVRDQQTVRDKKKQKHYWKLLKAGKRYILSMQSISAVTMSTYSVLCATVLGNVYLYI